MIQSMMSTSASWITTPLPCRPGDRKRPGAVAGHPDRDLRQILGPLQRDLLAVPVGASAVREFPDQLGRRLELAHLDGLQPDRAPRRVAAPDHHHDAPGRHGVERGVEARGDRRLPRARIGHAEPEADALGLRGCGGEERRAVLPEDVRVVGVRPVVAAGLCRLHELDEARAGRIGKDRDAELHGVSIGSAGGSDQASPGSSKRVSARTRVDVLRALLEPAVARTRAVVERAARTA